MGKLLSACSFLLFLPRHLLLGAAGEGILDLWTVRTLFSGFFEIHRYLGDHRTKNAVKNHVVAERCVQQLNEYLSLFAPIYHLKCIKITLVFLLLIF